MPWVYEIINGRISEDNVTLTIAYSGHPPHVNDPAAVDIPNVGPLPRGGYTISGLEQSPNTGPDTLILIPDPDNEMFGRSLFRIHGDDIHEPGQHCASDGCIVADHDARMIMWHSDDKRLEVVDTLKVERDYW
jgi:hypothetical protein